MKAVIKFLAVRWKAVAAFVVALIGGIVAAMPNSVTARLVSSVITATATGAGVHIVPNVKPIDSVASFVEEAETAIPEIVDNPMTEVGETYSVWEQDPPALRFIRDSLHSLHRKVDQIITTQDDVNAALTADDTALSDLATRVSGVEQGLRDEITQLQAANPSIDVTGLETHLAELKATADAIDALPPAPAPNVGAPATPAAGATPVTPDGEPTGESAAPASAPAADPAAPVGDPAAPVVVEPAAAPPA